MRAKPSAPTLWASQAGGRQSAGRSQRPRSRAGQRLVGLCLSLAVPVLLLTGGCTTPRSTQERQPLTGMEPVRTDADGLRVTLVRVLAPDGASGDFGWLECELVLENRGDAPLVVSNAKLLTRSGRYFRAAATHGETLSPPDPAHDVAASVATSAAGAAAGQLIPYGGLVVHAIASVAGASSADARARAEQQFRLRNVDGIELAPGGRMEGSAFFPRVPDPEALVIEFSQHAKAQRATLPMSQPRGP